MEGIFLGRETGVGNLCEGGNLPWLLNAGRRSPSKELDGSGSRD